MKKIILLLSFLPTTSFSSDATWSGATSSSWETATNWVEGVVPGNNTGASNSDTATFGFGGANNNAPIGLGEIFSPVSGTGPTFVFSKPLSLYGGADGYAIYNLSSQIIQIENDSTLNFSSSIYGLFDIENSHSSIGTVNFLNSASAGSSTTINTGLGNSGAINFHNISTTGGCTISTGISATGSVNFLDSSTATGATILNENGKASSVNFQDTSSLDTGTIYNGNGNKTGNLNFTTSASAGTGTVFNGFSSIGIITFQNASTAASSNITNGGSGTGTITFSGTASAASSTITNTSVGTVKFTGTNLSHPNATIISSGGNFDISGLSSGSVFTYGTYNETAAGTVKLGANTLVLLNTGATAINTAMQGTGGAFTYNSGNSSSVLTFTGANTYTGTTTVSNGVLALSGSGTIGNNGALVVNGGGFDMSGITGASYTIASASGTGGSIYLGSKNLTINNNSALITLSSNIHDGAFGGGGGSGGRLTYAGSALSDTLVLNGTNTYTGLTTASSGTLNIYGALGGGLTVNSGAQASYFNAAGINQAIINSGIFTLNSGSSLGNTTLINTVGAQVYFCCSSSTNDSATLTNNGSFVDLSAASGTVTMGAITNGSVGQFNLGSVNFQVGALNNTATISGALNDGGASGGTGAQFTKVGTGTYTLAGTNSYTGTTTVTAGTLKLTGSLSSFSSLTNNAIFDMSAAGNTNITNLNGTTSSANIALGAHTLTVLGSGNYAGSISGSGGGLTYSGLGNNTLILNGINTYTGTTTVASGILAVGDYLHSNATLAGSAVVDPAGALAGYGTIEHNLTNNGAVIPGGDLVAGELRVTGNYTQAANATYYVVFDSATSLNTMTVGGNATLAGALNVTLPNIGFLVNHPYTLLTAGSITGMFDTFTVHPFFSAYLQPNTIYDPAFLVSPVTMLELVFTYNAQTIMAAVDTPNQISVGENIIATGANSTINSSIAQMTSNNELIDFFDQLSGATYANQQVALAEAAQTFENQIARRIERTIWCNDYLLQDLQNYQSLCTDEKYWVKLYGGKNQLLDTFNVSGLSSNLYGGSIGIERPIQDAVIGAGLSYTHFNDNANGVEIAQARGDLYQGALYGRYDWYGLRIGASIDYGLTGTINASREIENTSIGTVQTHADYTTSLFGSQFYTSYGINFFDLLDIRPTVGFIYQQVRSLDFTEHSHTGFELNIDTNHYTSSRSQAGIALDTSLFTDIRSTLYVAWEREYEDRLGDFNANFAGVGQSFYIAGTEIGRSAIFVDAAIAVFKYQGFDLTIDYQGRFAKQLNENALGIEIGFL